MPDLPDSSPDTSPDTHQTLRDLIDVLSHELRQPIGQAQAAVDVALDGVSGLLGAATVAQDSDQAARVARVARAEAVLAQGRQALHAAQAHIDNTLAIAGLLLADSPVCLLDADVDLMVALAIADMPPQQAGRIRIERQTTTRTVAMEPHLMRLALRNLLSNALKFSPPDSPVVVRLMDSDAPLALLIDVIDQGAGIAQELLPHLFDKRIRHVGQPARTDGLPCGGLGLHIVRQAMRYQGGAAELLATGPRGSTLRLILVQG